MSLPNELYYYIMTFLDGFERNNMKLVCKLFNSFEFRIYTDNPEQDREVSLIKPSQSSVEKVALYGHLDILIIMINKYSYHKNTILGVACRGGHIDIVNLMISKGANDWDGGLSSACGCGNIDIINFMISRGANHWN